MATCLPSVSPTRVANLHVSRQFPRCSAAAGNGPSAALAVLESLGQVQMDPMNVVARSEHLTLWSRLPGYQVSDLEVLRSATPRVFEYWTRAASLLPLSLYPLVAPGMGRRRTDHWWPRWVNWWLDAFPDVRRRVLRKVEEDGPVSVSDFPSERGGKGWGSWKVTKQGLEALWTIGELIVCQRRGVEKQFDLPRRVLPPSLLAPQADDRERLRKLLRLALHSAGACRTTELGTYFGPVAWPAEARLGVREVAAMVEEGWLSLFTLSGQEARWVCLTEDLPLLIDGREAPVPQRMTFLCPFDNLLWERRRVVELFAFDYRFEGYTPASKRQYGCYVMPILWAGRLIGRIAPRVDRDSRRLVVNGIWIEPGIRQGNELVQWLAAALHELGDFVSVKAIDIVVTHPTGLGTRLGRLL